MADGLLKDLLEGKKYPTDLLLTLSWAIIAVVGVLILPDGNLFRIILGVPLLIFLPGYALASVLWPENERCVKSNDTDIANVGISGIERMALSFGLSIAIVSLVGLCLNYTPFGITFISSLMYIFIVILVFSGVAYYRRMKLSIDKRFNVDLILNLPKFPTERTDKMFVAVIVICIIISIFALVFVLVTPSVGEMYTELYILDEDGTAGNYPINITTNETAVVIVGIANHEYSTVNYTIHVGIENTTSINYQSDWSQPLNLTNATGRYERTVFLNHNDLFEEPFSFYIRTPGRYKIVWQLFIDGVESGYEVHLWVNVNAV